MDVLIWLSISHVLKKEWRENEASNNFNSINQSYDVSASSNTHLRTSQKKSIFDLSQEGSISSNLVTYNSSLTRKTDIWIFSRIRVLCFSSLRVKFEDKSISRINVWHTFHVLLCCCSFEKRHQYSNCIHRCIVNKYRTVVVRSLCL